MSTKITKSCAGPNIRKEYHFDAKMDPIYVKLHFHCKVPSPNLEVYVS